MVTCAWIVIIGMRDLGLDSLEWLIGRVVKEKPSVNIHAHSSYRVIVLS